MNSYLTSDMHTDGVGLGSYAFGAIYNTAAHRGTINETGLYIAWASYAHSSDQFTASGAAWPSGANERAGWVSALLVRTR